MADPAVNKEVEIAKNEAGKLAEQASVLKIRTEDDVKAATDKLVEIKRVAKDIEARRRSITQPLNQAIKEVNDLFKAPAASLSEAEKAIKSAMLIYQERVAARAARREEKLQGQIESGELDEAKGADKIENIKQAPTSVATGSGRASYKVVTKIRIVNAAELPAEYYLRERVLEALRIEVETDVRGGKSVPAGAEGYEERIVSVRA